MPRPPRLPAEPGGRFFARVDRFVCECPACGQLIHAYFDQKRQVVGRGRKPQRARAVVYNPITSRLTCPWCRRTWGVGLILYPLAPRRASRQPRDQRPSLAQLLELRRRGGAWLGRSEITGADEVNQAITSECSCPEDLVGGLDMACPIHGWQATNERLREQQAQPAPSAPPEAKDPPPDDPSEDS